MIKPPPTPSRPDNKPVILPVAINRLVQSAVQKSLEVAGLIVQTGGGNSILLSSIRLDNLQVRFAISNSVQANVILSIV